jgi:hypothetical protein
LIFDFTLATVYRYLSSSESTSNTTTTTTNRYTFNTPYYRRNTDGRQTGDWTWRIKIHRNASKRRKLAGVIRGRA